MKSCAACGRPPSNVCQPCLTGNPPPEKIEADRRAAAAAEVQELERKHAQRLRQTQQALTEIPELNALVDLFELPGTGVNSDDDQGHRTSLAGSKPPVDLDVVDLRDERTKTDERRTDTLLADLDAQARRQGVLPTLTSWVRDVDEHLDGTPDYVSPWTRYACCLACSMAGLNDDWSRTGGQMGCCVGPHRPHLWTPRTVIRECTFLLEHHTWLSEQEQFPEFATDITTLHRDLARACRVPIRATRYTCTDCGWDVQAMDNGTWYSCTGCKRAWTEIELHRMAERRRPKPLPECASLAGVSVRSLRTAVAGKRLRPVGRDGNTDLFALDDVLPIAAQVKLNRTVAHR